jgi:DNA-binding MarR family transcriptional regulator
VIAFFVAHPEMSLEHVNPIVDFIHASKFAGDEVLTEEGAEIRKAPWPDFSIKGRTLKSILRLVSAWHADLAISKHGAWFSWRKSGIQDYRFLEKGLEEDGDHEWTILELLDSGTLQAEGRAMHHCVYSYADRCCLVFGVRGTRHKNFKAKALTAKCGPARHKDPAVAPLPHQNDSVDRMCICVYIHYVKKQLDMTSVENCTCFNVRRVSRVITQFFDAEVRRHGIRPTQTPILGALQAKSGWSMAELSEWLGMERTTLLRNLRPLQRDGLVQAKGAGRGGLVELGITAKGRTALAKTLPAWRSAQDKVVSSLGKERWSTIIRDLQKAATKLRAQ